MVVAMGGDRVRGESASPLTVIASWRVDLTLTDLVRGARGTAKDTAHDHWWRRNLTKAPVAALRGHPEETPRYYLWKEKRTEGRDEHGDRYWYLAARPCPQFPGGRGLLRAYWKN